MSQTNKSKLSLNIENGDFDLGGDYKGYKGHKGDSDIRGDLKLNLRME